MASFNLYTRKTKRQDSWRAVSSQISDCSTSERRAPLPAGKVGCIAGLYRWTVNSCRKSAYYLPFRKTFTQTKCQRHIVWRDLHFSLCQKHKWHLWSDKQDANLQYMWSVGWAWSTQPWATWQLPLCRKESMEKQKQRHSRHWFMKKYCVRQSGQTWSV